MPKTIIGTRAFGRRRGVIICTCQDCKLLEFFSRVDCGIDFEFVRRVSGNIVDTVLEKDPQIVVVHVNGGSYADWKSIIADLNSAFGVPLAVIVNNELRIEDFSNNVDMTSLEPRSYTSRIQLASSLFCLAHGMPPIGSKEAPAVTASYSVPETNKRLLRAVEWILVLSLLLSFLVAVIVLLVKEDANAAATAFATIFSSTIAVFTSGGVIRLLQRWRQLPSAGHEK